MCPSRHMFCKVNKIELNVVCRCLCTDLLVEQLFAVCRLLNSASSFLPLPAIHILFHGLNSEKNHLQSWKVNNHSREKTWEWRKLQSDRSKTSCLGNAHCLGVTPTFLETFREKKVLLRERKRHTARRIASARSGALSTYEGGGGGSTPIKSQQRDTPSIPDGVPYPVLIGGTPHPISRMGVPPCWPDWGIPHKPEGGTPFLSR